ncbi:MAG: menaquinone biosynthesis protein [Bacteroidia bacterium]|nr:menaquinone biosynthesis protein [Bacteroidia bacterium]NNC86583.1 menaquinone biosynthesis protein [Bacteroidia bacterium]NNM15321.1 menaquinone biosynthesis protein [Bacteroidia bacterium]
MKLSIVNYINSLPFLKGLEKFFSSDELKIEKDIPSVCAKKLINNEVQVGLVPVAEIGNIPNAKIISEYCIGSDGNVGSVLLLSNYDKYDIKKIYLDNESRTSNMLAKIIATKFWRKNVAFLNGEEEFLKEPEKNAAYVIIGDKAFKYKNQFKHVFDLSNEWKKETNLPFVFACWVSNLMLPYEMHSKLNRAFKYGIENIDTEIENLSEKLDDDTTVKTYLHELIDYNFNEDKRKALEQFNALAKELSPEWVGQPA